MANANNHKQQHPNVSLLSFVRFTKALTFAVYSYVIIASVTLGFGFLMLLFGANQSASFTNFIYNLSVHFLAPFRGIFPVRKITDTAYFSTSALFAIIVYSVAAILLNSLITYIALKQVKAQDELDRYLENNSKS